MSQTVLIDRPPRIQPELPVEIIEIPSPPRHEQSGMTQLLQMGLPLLTMVAFMFVTMSGNARNPLAVLPMVLMVVSSGGIAVYTYLKEKRERDAEAAAYMERLVEMTRDMHNYHDQQRRFYTYNYPEKATTARIVRDARWEVEKHERTLRGNTRLWERRTTDEDFGVIRLGMGTLPSTVVYQLKDTEVQNDPLTRAAQKLQEDSRFVDHIPVIISLRPPRKRDDDEEADKVQEDEEKAEEEHARRTPAVHAVGIAGKRDCVYEFARATLVQNAVFHAAADLQLYVLAAHEAEWAWTERLPHCRGDENNPHTCFMDAVKPGGGAPGKSWGEPDEQPLPHFLESIRKMLAQRKLQLQETNDEGGARGDPTLPHLLVVVDLLDVEDCPDPLFTNLEGDAAILYLARRGRAARRGGHLPRARAQQGAQRLRGRDRGRADDAGHEQQAPGPPAAAFPVCGDGRQHLPLRGRGGRDLAARRAGRPGRAHGRAGDAPELRRRPARGGSLHGLHGLPLAGRAEPRRMGPLDVERESRAGRLAGRPYRRDGREQAAHAALLGQARRRPRDGGGQHRLGQVGAADLADRGDGDHLRPLGAQLRAGGLQGRRRVPGLQGTAALRRYHHEPGGRRRDPHVYRNQRRAPAPPEAERGHEHQEHRRLPEAGPAPDARPLPVPLHHHRRVRGDDRGPGRVPHPARDDHPGGTGTGRVTHPRRAAAQRRHGPDALQHQVPHLPPRRVAGRKPGNAAAGRCGVPARRDPGPRLPAGGQRGRRPDPGGVQRRQVRGPGRRSRGPP